VHGGEKNLSKHVNGRGVSHLAHCGALYKKFLKRHLTRAIEVGIGSEILIRESFIGILSTGNGGN